MDEWRYNNAEAKYLFSKKELVESNGDEDANTNTSTNTNTRYKPVQFPSAVFSK